MDPQESSNEKRQTAVEFDRLSDKWTELCFKVIELPRLLKILQPVVPDLEKEIKGLHKQGREYMEQELKTGVQSILETHDLVQKHNTMDRLVHEAKQRPPVQHQILPSPAQVKQGVMNKAKMMKIEQLQNMLDDLTQQNYELMNEIGLGQERKAAKITKLNEIMDEFTENVKVTSSIHAEDAIVLVKDLKP
ncbi:uncharacterized protein B0P05DRAFT_528196 [Gilbertella persicaria]|uniref:uncharacterized protein n=1 Tax=Gilbertella persicaria TaxID=101096 RepID=UPI00221EFC02|nr:uncharacterized protein B0P05DRAFT_528196 [Gilbertella persicaria]KAI8090963.1 hypothetical protein B0P05DRAFT_528196 [Gilbertella persicaria]